METFEEKLARVLRDHVAIAPYNPCWPTLFEEEKLHLQTCLPGGLIKRIEHFGSTAIPGLSAKPVIDILIEVASLVETRLVIAPVLEGQGYDYFWRPSWGDDTPPFYAWFIKRDREGARTHHLHMLEAHFEHWDGLLFRDYLREHRDVAQEYERIKRKLAAVYPDDRIAYTLGKGDFIRNVTEQARRYYHKTRSTSAPDGMASGGSA